MTCPVEWFWTKNMDTFVVVQLVPNSGVVSVLIITLILYMLGLILGHTVLVSISWRMRLLRSLSSKGTRERRGKAWAPRKMSRWGVSMNHRSGAHLCLGAERLGRVLEPNWIEVQAWFNWMNKLVQSNQLVYPKITNHSPLGLTQLDKCESKTLHPLPLPSSAA